VDARRLLRPVNPIAGASLHVGHRDDVYVIWADAIDDEKRKPSDG
jgi:hypothetical protein